MPWCGSAAAADVGGAGFDAGGDVAGEFLRTDGEDGLAVHDLGEPRVGLGDDWQIRPFGEALQEGEQAVGTESAVEARGVGLERVEERRDGVDVRPREELAVLAEGDGRENRELGVLLGGEKRGLELVGVAEGLEEDEIGAGFRAQADLLGEGVVGRVEFEVAGGLEEPARRADVQGDALCAGVACALDGGGDHVLERRVAVVFRRIRAEGVGRDDVRPGFEVGAVDGGDVRGTRQVPELGNFAGLKSAVLQLGAHRTVEKSDHERIPMMAVTLFEGIMRQVSVRVMPRRRCPSTAARKSRWVSSGRSP